MDYTFNASSFVPTNMIPDRLLPEVTEKELAQAKRVTFEEEELYFYNGQTRSIASLLHDLRDQAAKGWTDLRAENDFVYLIKERPETDDELRRRLALDKLRKESRRQKYHALRKEFAEEDSA